MTARRSGVEREGVMTALRGSERTGRSIETIVVETSSAPDVQYAGASGDYNPLDTDQIYATKIAGYPSVFAHGC